MTIPRPHQIRCDCVECVSSSEVSAMSRAKYTTNWLTFYIYLIKNTFFKGVFNSFQFLMNTELLKKYVVNQSNFICIVLNHIQPTESPVQARWDGGQENPLREETQSRSRLQSPLIWPWVVNRKRDREREKWRKTERERNREKKMEW